MDEFADQNSALVPDRVFSTRAQPDLEESPKQIANSENGQADECRFCF